MLIGELSKRTGFSHDTIRFYERKGLVAINRQDRRDNNYKEYPESVYERLVLIRTAKALGFTLNEIAGFIATWSEESACSHLTEHLTDKIERVDQQIRLLQSVRTKLVKSLKQCASGNCEFVRSVPSCLDTCNSEG
jgi:DNA-binding transcriptional MerR regulator